jgi:hypothetical protein
VWRVAVEMPANALNARGLVYTDSCYWSEGKRDTLGLDESRPEIGARRDRGSELIRFASDGLRAERGCAGAQTLCCLISGERCHSGFTIEREL